jgi:mono/diheme cytochrome c family protein
MAPFGALLDDEQVAAVVNYVRSHFGNSYLSVVRIFETTGQAR